MTPGADTGEFSSAGMTGPDDGDRENQYGGGCGGGNRHGAVAVAAPATP